MKPGELYYADLYEAGVRPVLIVSRRYSPWLRGSVVNPYSSAGVSA